MVNNYIISNISVHINSFYRAIHDLKVSDISIEKIEELKETSKELNNYFYKKYDEWKQNKYVRILEKIKTNPKFFNVYNSTEKLLLLMFIIDPNFEILLIYEEENDCKNIESRIEQEFGVYDSNLIKIEKWYIKYIADSKMKMKISNEIERRVFK